MPYPNFTQKHTRDALFTPREYLRYQRRLTGSPTSKHPAGAILCYSRSFYRYVVGNHAGRRIRGFHADAYYLRGTKGRVAIIGNFGIGAPSAVARLEELIAWGVTRFVSVGSAGALQPGLCVGDIVICNKAIRDEGASHHYLRPSKYSHSSMIITTALERSLQALGVGAITGPSWTIDTPYRETAAEVRQYRQEGILTVEMEAAALFAVARYREVQLGAIFNISDSLAGLRWQPQFHMRRHRVGLEKIFQAAVMALQG